MWPIEAPALSQAAMPAARPIASTLKYFLTALSVVLWYALHSAKQLNQRLAQRFIGTARRGIQLRPRRAIS